MKKNDKTYLLAIVALSFIWGGMVLSISFLEAWLKFRAPGVDLRIGLGIGRLVFGALNKVECVLAVTILIFLWLAGKLSAAKQLWSFGIAFLILAVQTFWLLPALDDVAEAIVKGLPKAAGNLHPLYVIFETLKVSALIIFGVKQFNQSHHEYK